MKKKLLAITLAGMMALSFTGCGSNTNTNKKENAKEQEMNKIDANAEKLNDMKGKNLYDGITAAKDYGFKVECTSESSGKDMTDYINQADDNEKKSYQITKVISVGADKSVTFTIANDLDKEEIHKKDVLSAKLDTGHAWTAAEKYGKKQYGDKFKLNYLVGKIDESAEDENTWSLKAECKVDGNKMTCEAKVTGTNDNPEVTSFDVY